MCGIYVLSFFVGVSFSAPGLTSCLEYYINLLQMILLNV